jgi:hypothetical protein
MTTETESDRHRSMNDLIRGRRVADDQPAADMNDFIRTGRRFAPSEPTITKEPDAQA